MRSSSLRAVLFAAGALLASACATDGEPSSMPGGVEPDRDPGSGSDTDEPAQPRKVLDHDYQVQETGYWCGPAATRIALSARMAPPSQQTLAYELGTTTNGTDWIGQITRTLNDNLGATYYVTTEMPNDPPTAAQRERLWQDVLRSIDADVPIVANIVAPPGNQPPGYPSDQTIYHYFAVVGYDTDKGEVFIADSANFQGNQHYWLSFDQLATLIPPKGYAALAATAP